VGFWDRREACHRIPKFIGWPLAGGAFARLFEARLGRPLLPQERPENRKGK
jgi:hypothetical protein